MRDEGRWDSDASKEIPKESLPRVEAFFDEYEALCRRMGLSLGHEDGHGAFEVGAFSEGDIEWARAAHLVGNPDVATDPTVPGRCATCRWAVAHDEGKPRQRFLECLRWKEDDGLFQPGSEYADGPDYLYVAPDFGCVQWEGK